MSTVGSFQIDYTQYLDPEGQPVQPLPAFAQDVPTLLALYRAMVLTRAFDTKAIALQRTGKLGTFASSVGQEAIGVGVASAMRAEDVLFPSYRDHSAQLLRGVSMAESLLYWGGDERGSCFAAVREDFPNCVPIGTQVCHAAGAAYAFQLRREPRVAVAVFGDGGTSKGDFYEGMNLAGVWGAPLVLIVNNNQWAISVPRSRQTAAQTLAQKAIAAGIAGRQVDGNDVIAVRQAAQDALDKARSGGGPTLIEALSYRLGDHTTADDATRYRDPDSVKQAWAREPILRLRNYLMRLSAWDKAQEEQLGRACYAQVEEAVAAYLTVGQPGPSAMFDHLYAALPRALEAQRAMALAFAPQGGEGGHG
ncbi:pyruvate dehydrogenase (acetyl-transferring) E1 component subunit alpha [Ralstonia pseudosolanacearum]|uniref:pyruvate dehydrogenase (acetyl-transferring) E1 component subunit alpha n=1 Tax=Ralstonia pseudosolanacearum TaxID=1310165 RepID=UPI002676396D|nr:pyruvate dehydrogenase (acetyl-transferring) E1 component subunit alpha [Ralstonia pseudosolanacearum]MDO3508976.1 pyruvate dehydrogenase (acetyl-transferring) E1 component subunit alpha [Ralstonia pseudosolanacearum]MDO3539151.1 pyruvate dehydrogenase (acetyl-transferring) E1 component subunit alpha [Ralstonia pseudosolanacearum]MDO3608358.1 pyruvate dehydrogenase (acetyl-transferring) E1 component subunit alpha [Ralstonia pseudosolanacearum]MDO3612866.1 pyruvate dehydrogenase (acetyl-trans